MSGSGSSTAPASILTSDEAAIEYVHRVASERYLPILAQLHADHLSGPRTGRNSDRATREAEFAEAADTEWNRIFDRVASEVQTLRNPAHVARILAAADRQAEADVTRRYPAPGDAPAPAPKPGSTTH